MEPAEPPIDVRRLRESLTDLGNPAVFRELLLVFLHDTPGRLAALRRAALAGDPAGVRLAAHTLKGTCGYVGARGLVRRCVEVEAACQAGGVAGATGLLDGLEQEFERVRAALEDELRECEP